MAAEGGPLGPWLALVLVGAHPPLPVALITFVLVLREGETSARPELGVGGGAGLGLPGDGGDRREWGHGETEKGGCQLQLRSGSIVRDLMG